LGKNAKATGTNPITIVLPLHDICPYEKSRTCSNDLTY